MMCLFWLPVIRIEFESIFGVNNHPQPQHIKQKNHLPFICLGWTWFSCNGSAIGMVNTIPLHPETPEGLTPFDYTPFSVCHSQECNLRANRVAHEFPRYTSESENCVMMNQCEAEMCDNCQVVRYVAENGRMMWLL